ncbi:MAG TPA: Xaa-Pro peptidase family protein [Candidatus Eremiobacteraeota bacterium]|nr:MAG: putative peptidase [bacterium ADurb.Bin363]HPZ09358.1 Xaa-Pro peptidase family protein [Candidatus Eremiobacteraeota bacterium]
MVKGVFQKRIESLKFFMEENSIDIFIATPGTNFYYISGIDTFRMERLVAILVPLKDTPFVICPGFELERLKDQNNMLDFYPWEEDENPYELVGKIIKDNIHSLAFEPTTYFETFMKIREYLPRLEFKDGGEIFSSMRLKKTPEEVQSIQKAVEITEENIDQALKHLHKGMSEDDFKSYLSGQEKLVQFGKTSSYPHSEGGSNILRENDVVLIDKGDIYDHYHSDITRTGYFGKIDSEFMKIWDIVRQARDSAIDRAAPEVPCELVDKAARDIIDIAGYGEYFTHRTGHGIGLDIHEKPYLVKGNKNTLEPGNVFTIEPGIYLPGKFGIRIEENVLITEDGRKVLSRKPTSPTIIRNKSEN